MFFLMSFQKLVDTILGLVGKVIVTRDSMRQNNSRYHQNLFSIFTFINIVPWQWLQMHWSIIYLTEQLIDEIM